MTTSRYALWVGLALGAVATIWGFGSFLVVAVFAAIGWAVGLALEGKIDVRSLLGQTADRR